MKIAIDAFGGDNAPDEVVKGAVDAVKEYGVDIVLTGDTKKLDECFERLGLSKDHITFEQADGVIEIEDNPKMILKEKKNCSMGVAMQMVADGRADAMISAGSTAALVMGGTLIVKRIKGVKRPSLTPVMPGLNNMYILLDGGANVDCRPDMLRQFAVMGSVYMNKIMGVDNPKVGLLNVGAEEEKGNALVKETFPLLKECPDINFIGSVEARDFIYGAADVVVTEAFAGNVMLKTIEGVASGLFKLIKNSITATPVSTIGAALVKPQLKNVAKIFDATEYGGAPLLGLNGLVVKIHGNASHKEVKNALFQVEMFRSQDVNGKIREQLSDVQKEA